jgi:hypothetical protein
MTTEAPTDAAEPLENDLLDQQAGDQSTDVTSPETATEPTSVETADDWKAPFAEVGIVDVDDVNQGIQRLKDAYQQRQRQVEELAEYNRAIAQRVAQSNQYAQPAAQPQPEPDKPQGWFDGPQLPAGYERFVVTKQTATGEETREWSPNTPANVKQQVEQYYQRVAEWQYKIGTPEGFREVLDQYISQSVIPQVEQTYGTRQRESEFHQVADQFYEKNGAWFWEIDRATGQPLVDPVSGDYRISLEGQKFRKTLIDLKDSGVQDPVRRLELAQQLFATQRVAQQAAPAAQRTDVAQTIEQQRQKVLGRRATPSTTRPAQHQVPSGDDSERLTHGRRFVEALKKQGVELS